MTREARLAAFAVEIREVLLRVRPKKPDRGVRLLRNKALRIERQQRIPLEDALAAVVQEWWPR